MATTARDIINLALKTSTVLGVGQTSLAEDFQDALRILNMMMGQWAAKRWMVYHLRDVSKVSTGAQSYTVGAGMDFDIARPDRIEAAFLRQLITQYPVDYPLSILEAREDYNRIQSKSLGTMATYVFYDSAYPTGNVYFWPIPQASIYELHLSIREPLTAFADLDTPINLPASYEEAIYMNLAGRLCLAFGLDVPPGVAAVAQAAINTIKTANAQVPRLTMPPALIKGNSYNVYTDQGR